MSDVGEPESTVDLADRIHGMVRDYVRRKAETRSRMVWDKFPDVADPRTGRPRKDVPEEFKKEQRKVCEDAFLAMRSRRSRDDFLTYFTGTICAMPHFLPGREYQALAEALLDEDRWEQVKGLAMLAVSGVWPSEPRQPAAANTPDR